MVFSSTVFLFLFLPIVLMIYYNPFFKSRTFRNTFLLLASLAFYAWGEPVFVFLMIISILITWFIGLKVQKCHSKGWLTFGICYHIAVLFVFKYLTFTATKLGLLLHQDMSFINISLPIGISFFTFQLMSYLFDIYYRKVKSLSTPLLTETGLYVALFPQLIAGPIVRYETIAAEISDRHESYDDVVEGMQRFVYGLGKKVLISNYVAQIADFAFDTPAEFSSVMTAWFGAVCYALQIYFDFSGYSDMAIGLGRMFGFHFNENFNYPYISKSLTEFWRRWHISLSSWFRDYVYIPLGGSRVKKSRWIFNLFIVWLLTGIWHGANWTFIVWGLFYFVFLLLEKLTGFSEKTGIVSRLYTLLFVIIAWVIFRADTVGAAVSYLGNMFGFGTDAFWDPFCTEIMKNGLPVIIAAVLGCTPLINKLFKKLHKTKFSWIESFWMLAVFILSILQIIDSSYNPFIYFNF